MRIESVVLVLALIAAGPAFAAEKAKGGKDEEPNNGQYVNVSPVAAPIVLRGQLINYVFVTARLDVAPNVDASRMRDKEPYFRDALVRAAHRTPFVKPGDYTHVNEPMLKSTLLAEAVRIAGPGVFTGVEILSAQPQKVMGLPKGDRPPVERSPIP
jgi:hypothetical protein